MRVGQGKSMGNKTKATKAHLCREVQVWVEGYVLRQCPSTSIRGNFDKSELLVDTIENELLSLASNKRTLLIRTELIMACLSVNIKHAYIKAVSGVFEK